MKQFWRCGLVSLVAALLIGGASVVTSAPAFGGTSVTSLTTKGWQATIAHLSLPSAGCFTASYPSLEWHATRCKVAPHVLFEPAMGTLSGPAKGSTPNAVGDDNDYSARVAGQITQATGSFADVSSNITEKGQYGHSGPQYANTFSLQLNTQFFATPTCSGASDPSSCRGWQQFVYDSHSNTVYMQYWLLNYGATCPSKWASPSSSSPDCVRNSKALTLPGGTIAASELASVRLSGIAVSTGVEPGYDAAELSHGSQAIGISNSDSVLDLAGRWNTTEFGVFGDGGGGEANFGANTTLEAQTTLLSNSRSAPTCVLGGTTVETNNLDLTSTPAIGTVGLPTMASKQTNGGTQPKSCAKEAETSEDFQITSVTPTSVSNAGGATLAIKGTGFLDVMSLFDTADVSFANKFASVPLTVESDTRATIIAPKASKFTGYATIELAGCALDIYTICFSEDAEGAFKYTST